ncbi:MAG: PIN domain-containing protein [Actinomycetota bacterium]|nr:PIN domain-containing protein [Actinomycetota bacterium]
MKRAADSSVLVAAFATWHEQHDVARRAVGAGVSAVAHVLVETYSVLTRLPEPHRAAPAMARDFLIAAIKGDPLQLDVAAAKELPGRLHECGVAGGATFDGLIALTAAAHGATLVSLDRRAADTYRRCGVRFELLGA